MTMDAIEASSVGVKTMADGTLRLTVDIEPTHAQAAFALFGKPGQPLALAALKPASSKPAAPKGGTLSQWVAMRCQEAPFQRWLQETFPRQWDDAAGSTPPAWAASVVRAVCSIESRAELDSNERAAHCLHTLIREPYRLAVIKEEQKA
jgi:hypothetical protein